MLNENTHSSAHLHLILLISAFLIVTVALFAVESSSDSTNGRFTYTDDSGSWDVQIIGENEVRIVDINPQEDIQVLRIPGQVDREGVQYSVVEIGPEAGKNKSCKAQKIEIPNTVERIRYEAFYQGLSNLRIIEFQQDSSLYEIEDRAFDGCGTWSMFVGEDQDGASDLKFPDELNKVDEVEIQDSGEISMVLSTGGKTAGGKGASDIRIYLQKYNSDDQKWENVRDKGNTLVNSTKNSEFDGMFDRTSESEGEIQLKISSKIWAWLQDLFEGIGSTPEKYGFTLKAYSSSNEEITGSGKMILVPSGSASSPERPSESSELPKYLQVTIPKSLQKIGDSALERVQKLLFEEGSSLQYIGNQTFQRLNDLFEVTFPNTITYLGTKPFNSCTGIHMESGGIYELLDTGEVIQKETGQVVVYVGESTEYEFPEQVRSVMDLAYSDTRISKVTMRDGISFGIYPFMGCTISEIDFGSVTSVPDYMFGLTKMKSLTIPKQIKTIGEKAFFKIEGLEGVEFESDSCLESISQYAFSGNTALTTVTFTSSSPGLSCEIGQAAFFNCNQLGNVTVGDFKIRYISDFAFSKHSKDVSDKYEAVNFNANLGILIPAETTYVGAYSFSPTHSIIASAIATDTKLGYGTIDVTKTNSLWKSQKVKDGYSISFVQSSSIEAIGEGAFRGIDGVQTVDLSCCSELIDVGKDAFYSTYFSTLKLPEECKITSMVAFGAERDNYGGARIYTGDKEGLVPKSVQTASNLGWFKEVKFQEGSQLRTLQAPTVDGGTGYSGMQDDIIDLTECLNLESVEIYGKMTLPEGVYDISIDSKNKNYTITNGSDIIIGPTDAEIQISQSTVAINKAILGDVSIGCDASNPIFSLVDGMLIQKQGDSEILVSLQKGKDEIEISEASNVTCIATGAFARTSLSEMTISKNLVLSERVFDGISDTSAPTVIIAADLNFDGEEFAGDYSSITFLVGTDLQNWNVLSSMGAVYRGSIVDGSTVYVPVTVSGVGAIGIVGDDSGIGISMPGGYTLYDVQIDQIRGSAKVGYDAERISISDAQDPVVVLSMQVKERRSGNVVVITFDANEGNIDGSETSVLTLSRGLTILDSEIPVATAERRDFAYWSDRTGSQFDFNTPIQTNTQLSAVWGATRDPVITIQNINGVVLSDGAPVTTVPANGTVTLSFIPNSGYEPISWIVDGIESGSASDSLEIKDPSNDVTVSVKCHYYASSTSLPSTVDRDLPDYEDMFRTVRAFNLGGAMNMSGMNWTGHSSVPLIVDGYIYLRVKDTLYKAESDTGYIVATARSAETSAYYHHLCYGNGMIVDSQTSKVFDLDLSPLFTLDQEITGAEYHDGYFYTSGKTLKRFPADSGQAVGGVMSLETIGEFPQKVYSSYGFSHSVFVGDTIYRVSADGNMRGIVAMGIGEENLGVTGFVELKDITGYYLDDGWISYNDGYIYLTAYTQGLFGAVAVSGDDKVAYVKADGTGFGTSGSYTFDGMKAFASEAVFIDGYAFVNVGHLYMMRQNSDGSLTYLADSLGCGTHGSIVVKESDTVKDDYTVYMIPYSSFKESMVVVHCYKDGNQWRMDRYATVHNGAQYNSQAIRSDLEGRLVWYNDSGKVNCWTTPEKNRFFFFIEDSGVAKWYESYGATAKDALKALGSDVVMLSDAGALVSVNGQDAGGWQLYYLKNDIPGYQNPSGSPNGWRVTESLGDKVNDAYHYYLLTTGDAVPSAESYKFVDGSTIGTYIFADNVGDRTIVGKTLVAGADVSVIRFYNGGEEIQGSALIGATGSEVNGSFPAMYKQGYLERWYIRGTQDRVTELPDTFGTDAQYEVGWIEATYLLNAGTEVVGNTIFFDFSVEAKAGESNLYDPHVIVFAKYENDFFTKSYTAELEFVDGRAVAKIGVGGDRLSNVIAYLVEGMPTTQLYSDYAVYQYTVEGTGS